MQRAWRESGELNKTAQKTSEKFRPFFNGQGFTKLDLSVIMEQMKTKRGK